MDELTMMNKYCLTLKKELVKPGAVTECDVRSQTVSGARKIASENAGTEGSQVWLDYRSCSCVVLLTDVAGGPGIVFRDVAGEVNQS